MLIPNLSVLLAERRLTLSKVSADTGISRTTLTALSGRAARGIQFATLNALCQYLRVTPNDLFIYRPFDLTVDCDGLPDTTAAFTLTRAGIREFTCALACKATFHRNPSDPTHLDKLTLRLSLPEGDGGQAARLVALLQALPRPALAEVEFSLLRPFDARIDPALAPDDYTPEVLWPWQA